MTPIKPTHSVKTDLSKTHKSWYQAKLYPELVQFAPAHYLSIEGKGDPSGLDYANDLQALYSVAYALKFIYKAMQQDFVVAKLEGQWSFDEKKFGSPTLANAPLEIPRSEWNYRSLIRLPEFVDGAFISQAIEKVKTKRVIPGLDKIRLYELPESLYLQILHTGPFSKEPESLQKLATVIQEKKLGRNGLHHEVYLSDFRKTNPEKLKTILREPVIE